MPDHKNIRYLPDKVTLAKQGGHPATKPKDASTLLLLRRDGDRIKVLAGRRSEQHKFMPGLYVFPGGRRDTSDSRVPVEGDINPRLMERLRYRSGATMTPARMRALAVAAIRETYEEVGLAIGKPNSAPGALLPFTPKIGDLRFVARAITPPGRIRRFDTRFFAAFTDELDADLDQLRPGPELEKLEWIDIAGTTNLKLHAITRAVLSDVSGALSLSPHLSLEIPVPFYYMQRGKFVREEILR